VILISGYPEAIKEAIQAGAVPVVKPVAWAR
jgi:hypothetical protein